MTSREIITKENGPSGRMYFDKYLKKNYIDIYNDVINYCNDKLNDIPFKEKVYHYVHDIKNKITCKNPNCNNYVKFKNSTIGYYNYCSIQCISSDPNVKMGKEKKSYEKYGTKAPGMNLEIKEKMIRTNNERYGGNCPLSNLNIKEKSSRTLFKNYGVNNPNKSKEILEKRTKTFSLNAKKKYLEIYKEYGLYDIDYENKKMSLRCEKDHNYEISLDLFHNRKKTKTILCTVCNPINYHISGQEMQLQEYIKKIYCDDDIILNDRSILKPYELDIFLPTLNLAFEFNGLFYHSEKYVGMDYHLNKTESCEKNGIKLIQIYEDDWINKQDIIKSRIINLLKKSDKIYARKCEIREIEDNQLIREFLDNNHLQGFLGSKIKLGLYYNNDLVSLMTFGALRKSMGQKTKENSYEMLRFCNKLNTNVIGGASKLFKYFLNKYNPIEITSYADRSWSTGDLYDKLGFKFVHKTQPNYYYIIDKNRKHRFFFRKDILVREGFDINKTEKDIMLERKIYRIYDSGSLKYIYKKKGE